MIDFFTFAGCVTLIFIWSLWNEAARHPPLIVTGKQVNHLLCPPL